MMADVEKHESYCGRDTEEDYGFIRPSLIKQLRSILDQYPDDGQILKELLQNAEDAGATEVKLLYDENWYDKDRLHHPDMAQFQGPALFAYNNALFEEKDWTGIRMLQDSIKEKNPLKVGRFGLGFKSVLHMTDLPSVISADRLFIIDPHEKYFQYKGDRTSGYSWNLKQKQTEMSKICDQFKPYMDKFGCDQQTFQDGFYNGTLFRFPLRRKGSSLSATLYSTERIMEMFNVFEGDAHRLLLFLKHLESIQLYHTKRGENSPRLLYEVRLKPDCLNYIRKVRQNFLEQCRNADTLEDVSLDFVLSVETIKYSTDRDPEKTTHSWLINEYKGGASMSPEIKAMQSDSSLNLVPLVGVALALNVPRKQVNYNQVNDDIHLTDNKLSSDEILEQVSHSKPDGQVFCFLPLPVEQKTSTGLPVHINGYFAISQNRRHLKWPTKGHSIRLDKSVLWNQCLLQELLPVSYTKLLVHGIHLSKTEGLVSPEDIYYAIPDLVIVEQKWQFILQPLFDSIFKHPVIYTATRGGQWIMVHDAVFNWMKEDADTAKVIVDVLNQCGLMVANAPKHLLHALGAFSHHAFDVISPSLVRAALRKKPEVCRGLVKSDVLMLLRYCLKDDDFQDMIGVHLLPLADKRLVPFLAHGETIFIPTHEAPRQLFPGLESCLIADDLDDLLMYKLSKMADEKVTQLRYVNKEAVLVLVHRLIPLDYCSREGLTVPKDNCPLSVEWLQYFWTYLRKQYPVNIQEFCGLPVLPLNKTHPVHLVPLVLSGPCVMNSAMGVELDPELLPVLDIFGVFIVKELPEYVQSHASVLGNYVRLPFRDDIIELLFQRYQQGKNSASLIDKLDKDTSAASKRALVQVIAGLTPTSLSVAVMQFLRKLPVFPCNQSKSNVENFVCVESVPKGANVKSLSYKVSQKLIDTSNKIVSEAATLLGVQILEERELLLSCVFNDIKDGCYDVDTTYQIIAPILTRFSQYASDCCFIKELSDLSFVLTDDAVMKKPKELIDPDDELIMQLFSEEQHVFPKGFYAEPHVLIHLRQLGLKTSVTLLPGDVLRQMYRVKDLANDHQTVFQAVNKGKAVLHVLCHRPDLLYESTEGKMLIDWASSIPWVPALSKKPASYPKTLDWFRGHATIKPSEACSLDYVPLVGSVRAIVDGQINGNVMEVFGWNEQPPVTVVIDQLKQVVTAYNSGEKDKFLAILMSIYDYLTHKHSEDVCSALLRSRLHTWIWHGDGFTSLDSVVAENQFTDLSPYIYSLPPEMIPFLSLFESQGLQSHCSQECLVLVLRQISTDIDEYRGNDQVMDRLLQLVVNILNYLGDQQLTEKLRRQIFMPVISEDSCVFRMLPVHCCTYCDVDWIRKGFDLMEFDEQDGITFIHQNLPVSTAKKLGVPTLMSRMLHAEELVITGFGQGEPLTSRLKQLLDDYKDGLAVFKEMIQNADDAGATEINFMYDERTNEDSMKYLIDEGMRVCQGPALWIHNNSVFTDQDFVNITKLGGATKKLQTDKIGTFGLGFNVVYNLTDVPSIISRNNIVFFDPHTTHLGKCIKDKTRPGIKINMTKNKTLLRKLSDQFRPYQNVFGCQVETNPDGYYNGTLFRLPLRTKQQAAISEISSYHYDSNEVLALFNLFVKYAHNLLLFTQNLQKIGLHHIPEGGCPANSKEVFVLEKHLLKTLRHQAVVLESTTECKTQFLTAASHYINAVSKPISGRLLSIPQIPQLTLLIQTTTRLINNDLGLNIEGSTDIQHWLISLCVGQERSKKMTIRSKENLLPVGGIAIHLKEVDNGFVPENIETVCKGLAFCFLPLPSVTGLPVHINAMFALESSRRSISQRADDEKEDFKTDWNEALLEDAVFHAYIQALWDVKQVLPFEHDVLFYDIWPTFSRTEAHFQPLVVNFYKNISTLLQVPLCSRKSVFISLSSAVFLDLPTSVPSQVVKSLVEVFSQYSGGFHVVTPPEFVIKSLVSVGYENILAEKLYSLHRFYEEVFFPNISKLKGGLRDTLLVFAFQLNNKELNVLLRTKECIPSSPDGKVLKKVSDLVHPTGLAARLYTPVDGHFPHGESFTDGNVLNQLQQLGLKVNDISWRNLVERAESIQNAYITEESLGKNRLINVLAFLDRKLLQASSYKSLQKVITVDEEEMLSCSHTLRNIAFLPALQKPNAWPIFWKSSELGANELVSSCNLYPKEMRYLVSATQMVVNDEHMTARVNDFFGFAKKAVSIEQVMTQLEHVLVVDIKTLENTEKYEELQKTLYAIYKYIQDFVSADSELAEDVCSTMRERPCVLVGNRFFVPTQLAINFQYDCSPYLYIIPSDMLRRFKPLMSKIGVKDNFTVKEFIETLNELYTETDGKVMTRRQLDISLRITSELSNSLKLNKLSIEDATAMYGEIYIPDIRGTLQPSRCLCYNDCPWITDPQLMNFTHPDVSYNTAACLGVKTKRQETLRKYRKGIPFGQKEELTNSLKRILSTYQCDYEILKEMIQNADDAEATQIHFIRDSRQHPKEHVFGNSWKALQGPALCVYNNRPFTIADLEGIQRLGEGSKSRDPSKTGQYGIGFSSVYHLTDVPSLLTSSRELGKMLCVFDPHCCYVPGATPAEPGMMYRNVDQLQAAFCDVFDCYLIDKFDVENGTMFRLPLRTLEMAQQSKISKHHITMSKIHTMLEKLKSEAFEILLFTNYLKEIKISDIDPLTGNLINTYTVTVMLSEKQSSFRYQIAEQVKEWSCKLKNRSVSLSDVSRHELVYTAYLTDTLGRQEKWCVCQVIGFNPDQDIPHNVQHAFDDGNLVLLPCGGVACLLEERINGQPNNSNKTMNAFCFLPLPIKTGLPVHVNSHFALCHENRRHLWTRNDETSDYHQEWNDLMCSTVIADAYVNLLKHIRMQCLTGTLDNDRTTVTCTRQMLNSAIETYTSYFPLVDGTQTDWQNLARNVYITIARRHAPVLPAIQECTSLATSASQPHAKQWYVTWIPPIGEGADKAFFTKQEKESSVPQHTTSFLSRFTNMFKASAQKHVKTESQILKEVLLNCGLRLVEAPSTLVQNFESSGVEVDFISPGGVISFLQSCSSKMSSCRIGSLPCKLDCTPFVDEKQLDVVLQYCKLDSDFANKLHGLPLLLTEDGMLRMFDEERPIFYSLFSDLVPERGDLFLKKTLLDSALKHIDLAKCPVFTRFDITELSIILPSKLPVSLLGSGKPIAWDKYKTGFPNEMWIKRLWTFLREEMDCIDEDKEEENPDIGKILKPLEDWCLLPVKVYMKSQLFPLSKATDVIYYADTEHRMSTIRQFLQRFGVPELDVAAINMVTSDSVNMIKCVVTSFDKPCALLRILHLHLVEKNGTQRVPVDVANCLLGYFVDNITELGKDEETVSMLCNLQLYKTICGHMISLTNCAVYTLPSKIPTDGIDIWQNQSGTVFLERNDNFQPLYDYLHCASLSIVDVYSQFIFQHLEYFPEKDRLVHLYHVYLKYLKSEYASPESESLLAVLKDMPFIDDDSGELRLASHFYDPNNVVFKVMLTEDMFAPVPKDSPFKESQWYDFLGRLGMNRTMNVEMFVTFAQQVERESHSHDKNLVLTKSKVLVQHLYSLNRSARNAILSKINDIRFIAQADASVNLQRIHPQYGDVGKATLHFTSFSNSISKKFENIIWTEAALLPEWASPLEQHWLQADEIEEIMEGLKIQKEPEVEKVLGHLLTLCRHISDSDPRVSQAETCTVRKVFTDIYRYLTNKAIIMDHMMDKLSNEAIVLISDRQLVKPCQTVVNLYEADEIRPYLFKVPLHLGEFVPFFKLLGATDRVSVVQYVAVLEAYKKNIGVSRCSPNQLRGVFKAVKGLLDTLENNKASDKQVPILYLPNESGHLVDASRLVFNDVPSFYDRVKQLGLQFVADLRECGLKSRHTDELLALLPQQVRPVMLSTLVREELMDECKQTESGEGLAGILDERVRSETFLTAVARLVYHQAHKTGHKMNKNQMYQVLDRLSTIHIRGVDRVVTHLTFRSKHIEGSKMEKVCFVERRQGPKSDICQWLVYIQKDSPLGHGVLVPLAEVINCILSGMLHDSVLYLLPVLSCSESEIHQRLDNLNIRTDRVQSASCAPLLPVLGSQIEEDVLKQLKWGEIDFEEGEYIGYKPKPELPIVHAMVKEEVMSPDDNRVYLIDTGCDQNTVIADASQLFKFDQT